MSRSPTQPLGKQTDLINGMMKSFLLKETPYVPTRIIGVEVRSMSGEVDLKITEEERPKDSEGKGFEESRSRFSCHLPFPSI
jgi:hypothetical protein